MTILCQAVRLQNSSTEPIGRRISCPTTYPDLGGTNPRPQVSAGLLRAAFWTPLARSGAKGWILRTPLYTRGGRGPPHRSLVTHGPGRPGAVSARQRSQSLWHAPPLLKATPSDPHAMGSAAPSGRTRAARLCKFGASLGAGHLWAASPSSRCAVRCNRSAAFRLSSFLAW